MSIVISVSVCYYFAMKTVFLPKAYHQGSFKDFEEAQVSVATHALHYGTAAFGGMRGWVDGKNPNTATLFRLKDHAKRLANSAKYLQADFTAEKIEQLIINFIQQNKPNKPFYIRPLVYTSDLGISPRVHNLEKDLLIYGLEMGDYLSPDGVSVCFSSWTRQPDSSLPLRGKISGAYITSSLAKTEANERGFDEAILLRTDGKVAEATGMNVFVVRDGTLITPGVEQDILEGITRRSVIEIAKDLDIPVIERAVDKSELYIADEVFLCGSAARVTPVNKVESTKLPSEKTVSEKIGKILKDISQGNSDRHKDWVTQIKYKP